MKIVDRNCIADRNWIEEKEEQYKSILVYCTNNTRKKAGFRSCRNSTHFQLSMIVTNKKNPDK